MLHMKYVIRLILYCLTALAKVARRGGVKVLVAENIVLKQQLIVLMRHKKRPPNLTSSDRITFGFLTTFINPKRLSKMAVAIKPATLLRFHKALVNRKYSKLFSAKTTKKPGPKGPSHEIINLILEMKQRNPRFGYLKIAMQIQHAFGIELDEGVVRRVLAKHYKPTPRDGGSSWLSLIGNMKDSLWSIDLFRCESIHLKSHWVMVVMDQFTRRIIGFAVHTGDLDGTAICCMFNRIIAKSSLPKYLSSDNDPLFQFYRWQANLRVLNIDTLKGTGEIKTVPYVPISHPFIERLIGTIRREYLDRLFFWNDRDLQNKLNKYQQYYNVDRAHSALDARTPDTTTNIENNIISLDQYRWKSHCRGLFDLPIAA